MALRPERLDELLADVAREQLALRTGSPSDREIGTEQLADLAVSFIPDLVQELRQAQAQVAGLKQELAEQQVSKLALVRELHELKATHPNQAEIDEVLSELQQRKARADLAPKKPAPEAAPAAGESAGRLFAADRTAEEMQALRDDVRRKASYNLGAASLVARNWYRLDALLNEGDELQRRLQAAEATNQQLQARVAEQQGELAEQEAARMREHLALQAVEAELGRERQQAGYSAVKLALVTHRAEQAEALAGLAGLIPAFQVTSSKQYQDLQQQYFGMKQRAQAAEAAGTREQQRAGEAAANWLRLADAIRKACAVGSLCPPGQIKSFRENTNGMGTAGAWSHGVAHGRATMAYDLFNEVGL